MAALPALSTASTREILAGRILRAAGVEISKSGIKRTHFRRDEILKRWILSPRATVRPPDEQGGALSGWPSSSAHNWKIAKRLRTRPLSSFKPCKTPSRIVALLPSPRQQGIFPLAVHENVKGRRLLRLKNSLAARVTISSWAVGLLARLTG